MRRWITLVLVAAIGCKGADGATGPQGPTGAQGPAGVQGPAGPTGAGTRLVFTGTLGTGGGFADLPPSAGTMANLPAYGCYLLFNVGTANTWIQTGQQLATNATCAIAPSPTGSGLRVALAGGTAGQAFAVVVVY